MNVMHLNHPETIPPTPRNPLHGKIVFHKTSPWCQRGWGLLPPLGEVCISLISVSLASFTLRTVPGIQCVLPKYLLHEETNEWMGHFRHMEGTPIVVPGVLASVLTTPHEKVSPGQGCEVWKDRQVCPRVTEVVDRSTAALVEQRVESPEV